MNYLDVGLVLLTLILMILGWRRGLWRELGYLSRLVLSLAAGVYFHPQVKKLLAFLGQFPAQDVVAFGLVFASVLFLLSLPGLFWPGRPGRSLLGQANRLLGLDVALVKAALAAVLIVALVALAFGPKNEAISGSRLAPPALAAARWGLNEAAGWLGPAGAEKIRALAGQLHPDQARP